MNSQQNINVVLTVLRPPEPPLSCHPFLISGGDPPNHPFLISGGDPPNPPPFLSQPKLRKERQVWIWKFSNLRLNSPLGCSNQSTNQISFQSKNLRINRWWSPPTGSPRNKKFQNWVWISHLKGITILCTKFNLNWVTFQSPLINAVGDPVGSHHGQTTWPILLIFELDSYFCHIKVCANLH